MPRVSTITLPLWLCLVLLLPNVFARVAKVPRESPLSDCTGVQSTDVVYNKKPSYYQNADITGIFVLTKKSDMNLAGCAKLCVLDWAKDADGLPLTTASASSPTGSAYTATNSCEAFFYNTKNQYCYLAAGSSALNLRSSKRYFSFSGYLECPEPTDIPSWAGNISGR